MLDLDAEQIDEERKVDSKGNMQRQMAIHNKRPGGVEARQMADNNTGLDIESDSMPRQDELETYRILFELFDRDVSGFI